MLYYNTLHRSVFKLHFSGIKYIHVIMSTSVFTITTTIIIIIIIIIICQKAYWCEFSWRQDMLF